MIIIPFNKSSCYQLALRDRELMAAAAAVSGHPGAATPQNLAFLRPPHFESPTAAAASLVGVTHYSYKNVFTLYIIIIDECVNLLFRPPLGRATGAVAERVGAVRARSVDRRQSSRTPATAAAAPFRLSPRISTPTPAASSRSRRRLRFPPPGSPRGVYSVRLRRGHNMNIKQPPPQQSKRKAT